MSFEERMDRLTERHEALAQTVELNSLQIERNSKSIEQLEIQIKQTSKTVDVLVHSIQDLVGIVRSHEARLNGLENR